MTTDEPNGSVSKPTMEEQALTVMLREWDTLKDLNSELEGRTQSLFNYYLTLVATVVTGSILVLQIVPNLGERNSILVVGVILMFLAVIGLAYSFSLAHLYAHISRYTQALDEIRRHLFNSLQLPLPSLYDQFRTEQPIYSTKAGRFALLGTFHTYETIIVSVLLAVGLFLILLIANPNQIWSVNLVIALTMMGAMFILQTRYASRSNEQFSRTVGLRISTRR